MSDILDDIAARLRRHTLDEAIALVRNFLTGLDEHQHKRFLALLTEGTGSLIAAHRGHGLSHRCHGDNGRLG